MTNLLPEKALQRIRGEYRARFMLTGSSLAIGAALFTALALLPSFSVLYLSRPSILAKANQVQQSKADSSDIAKAQALIAQLAPVTAASSSTSSAIIDALSQKPGGVHIDTIAYTSSVVATLTLGGVADSRASIDKFRTQLQTDPLFSSVKLPVGDLVGGQGGRFTITITGHF